MIKNWFKKNPGQTIFIFGVLVSMVIGWTLYILFGHQLIKAMYEGRAIAVLNSVIKEQAVRPLEHYIKVGDILFFKINFLFILLYFISSFLISFRYKRYSLAIIVSLAILLAGSIVHIYAGYSHGDFSGHAYGSDDAYISYRYARNFAEGHGIVYNHGERVEGYSNFLYVLLMSLSIAILGAENIYRFSCVINIFFAATTFFVFYRRIQKELGNSSAVAAVFLFSCCPSIWIWAGAGTETVLVLLIQITIWMTVERLTDDQDSNNLIPLSFLVALSVLARADGFIVPIITIFYFLFRRKIREALYISSIVILIIFVYFSWRYSYYGDFLPNTYYVKVSGPVIDRFKYAIRLLCEIAFNQGLLPYLLIIMCSIFLAIKNFVREGTHSLREIRFDSMFAAGWLIYWIYIGGDHFKERFLIVLFPLGICGFLKFFEGNLTRKRLMFLILLLVILQLQCLVSDRRFDYSFPKYDHRIVLGKFLGRKYPGKTLATGAAGKIPYFSGLKTTDMLGLNDGYIGHKDTGVFFEPGHNKHDLEYVLSREPDIIVIRIKEDMDTTYPGLTKEEYEKRYRLKYLVNRNRQSLSTNIMDMENLDNKETAKLLKKGYILAVLEKVK